MNIIVIILDTLRKDFGERHYSKIFRNFGFVYIPNVISPSPWTLPTHVSMLTGEYPIVHEIHETQKVKIPQIKLKKKEIHKLIPLRISKVGYRTILISANPLIQPSFGFIGFDEVYDIFYNPIKLNIRDKEILQKYKTRRLKYILTPLNLLIHREFNVFLNAAKSILISNYLSKNIVYRLSNYPSDKGISKAIRILKTIQNEQTQDRFIFINLMEVHEPYYIQDVPDGLRLTLLGNVSNVIISKWREGYLNAVRYQCNKLRYLLNILKYKDFFRNSVIIITSDHGQLLGEGNRLGHGAFLDDELIRVPLWIKIPTDEHYHNLTLKLNRYFTLNSIYEIILKVALENTVPELKELIRDTVFSETYGSPIYIPNNLSKIQNVEKHRIAVYHGPYKGIYNVDDRTLECVKSYDGSEITEEVKDMLVKDVKKFLRGARLKTAVRRVNLKGKI